MSVEERLKSLEDWRDAVIQAMVQAPQQKQQQEQRQWTWSPDKIKWTQDVGTKGPYERSEDINNTEFKAMLKDLQEHKGKLNREGRFYWIFKSGSTVGRTMPK